MRVGKQRAGRAISTPYGMAGDELAADVVRRIYRDFTRLYVPGSLSEIAAGLNVDQVATARGGRWHASGVRYILSNPAYSGTVIDDATFQAAQDRLHRLRPGPAT